MQQQIDILQQKLQLMCAAKKTPAEKIIRIKRQFMFYGRQLPVENGDENFYGSAKHTARGRNEVQQKQKNSMRDQFLSLVPCTPQSTSAAVAATHKDNYFQRFHKDDVVQTDHSFFYQRGVDWLTVPCVNPEIDFNLRSAHNDVMHDASNIQEVSEALGDDNEIPMHTSGSSQQSCGGVDENYPATTSSLLLDSQSLPLRQPEELLYGLLEGVTSLIDVVGAVRRILAVEVGDFLFTTHVNHQLQHLQGPICDSTETASTVQAAEMIDSSTRSTLVATGPKWRDADFWAYHTHRLSRAAIGALQGLTVVIGEDKS